MLKFSCICSVITFVNSEPSRVTWKYNKEDIVVSPDLTDKSLQISVEHEKIQQKPTPLK
jgi:hypothetical protein